MNYSLLKQCYLFCLPRACRLYRLPEGKFHVGQDDGDPINFVKFPYGQEGGDGAALSKNPQLSLNFFRAIKLGGSSQRTKLLSQPRAFVPHVSQGLAGLARALSGNAV